MDSEPCPLHMLFFPLMAAGHMIPMAKMASLFSSRGVKATILTTPANAELIRSCIHHSPVSLELVPFPSAAVGLPEGLERLTSVTSPEMLAKFPAAIQMLRHPFDRILRNLLPDCIVTDMFLPWTLDAASELGIPRLVFHGTSFFSLCAADSLRHHSHTDSTDNQSSFVLPGLPHRITMLRSQVPDWKAANPAFLETLRRISESEEKSYGVVVNSFYDLEPDYAEHYKSVVGRRAWTVGPLPDTDHSDRSLNRESCLKWLDSKTSESVVYVCFGSLSTPPAAQIREVAVGLESSDHPFVWVVRDVGGHESLPEGFEERMDGKGLIIRGWSPQTLILRHPAIGGFVTHCGWNSCMEAVAAGVPMVTWPLFGEQFYNERLVVDVLRVGVSVGVKKFVALTEDWEVVAAAAVAEAVGCLMGSGEEAVLEMRRRAREMAEMGMIAGEEGGSSYVDVGNLIKELMRGRDDRSP